MKWKDKQKEWQEERQQVFEAFTGASFRAPHEPPQRQYRATQTREVTSIPSTQTTEPTHDYHLFQVRVQDGRYHFGDAATEPLTLYRNTTYLFDQSHPSNKGHLLCISRHPSRGQVRDMGSQGDAGSPGALLTLYIGDGRPKQLYYYDVRNRGLSGDIIVEKPE